MSDSIFNNPSPQFGTAEYVGSQGNEHCQFCHRPVTGTYYRVGDSMACPACAGKLRAELAKNTHTAYMRALLYGSGAAIAGMILYATFAITTGIIIGYVSLAVGWMVGTAIKKGSGGVGGRRYQITAALLTYAAVSMAAIPISIHYASEHRQAQLRAQTLEQSQLTPEQQQTKEQQLADEQRQLENGSGQPHQDRSPAAADAPASSPTSARPSIPQRSFSQVLLRLSFVGIASPFFDLADNGPSAFIGIVILLVGIRIAWRLTGGANVVIYGPFETSAQSAR